MLCVLRLVVYLIQSDQSRPKLNAWLCGGALVKTNKILTSAACLIQSTNIYAIAGYRKYISTDQLDNDNCTRITKRRVVRICVPHGYHFDPKNATTWMTLDVGVAVIERPYRHNDTIFRLICDYIPKPIPIVYHKELTYDDLDIIALGWGFRRARQPDDSADYNSKMLKYLHGKLVAKSICQKAYKDMDDVIESYMFCAQAASDFMNDGGILLFREHTNTECSRRYGASSKICDSNDTMAYPVQRGLRRQAIYDETTSWGICQNDHGGPLLAYIGGKIMLIGIAVNTIYGNAYECVGPALFTSTACASNFIMCMLSNNPFTRRASELAIKEQGFEIIWKDVEWAAEPADHSTPAPAASVNYKQENTTTRLNTTTGGTGNKTL